MLKILEDVPNERLILSRKGIGSNLFARVLLTLVFAPFAPGVPLAVAVAYPGNLNAFVPLLVTWFVAFGWVTSSAGAAFSDWSFVSWDRKTGRVQARRSGGLLIWVSQTYSFPIDALEGIVVVAGSGGRDHLPITIRMRFFDKRQKLRWVEPDMRIDGVESRLDAMDLAFRIARVLGWSGYAVRQAGAAGTQTGFATRVVDTSELRLELFRDHPEPSVGLPVPATTTPNDFLGTAAMGRFEEPPFELPSMNPAKIGARYEVLQWDPGRIVAIFRPPLSRGALWGAALVGFGLGGVAGLILVAPVVADVWAERATTVGVSGVAGALLNAFWFGHRERVRETVIDWEQGRLALKDGTSDRVLLLQDIEAVNVWGRTRTEPRTKKLMYRCDVELALRDGDRLVATTVEADEPDPVLGPALSMAIQIARELHVPWRFMGFAAERETDAIEAGVPPAAT